MEAAQLIDQLEADGVRLAEVAARSDRATLVPGLDWTVGEVVRHTGGVHRWCDDLLRGRVTSLDSSGTLTDSGPPDDAQVLDWFRAGVTELAATLRNARSDLQVPTLLRAESPLHFWARRQAHETAIHRADVERAAHVQPDFDAEFAQDGLAELLLGFGQGRPFAVREPGTLALLATDGPCWLVTFGGERNESVPTEDPTADARVCGTSAQLYLWLWNRPASVTVEGDRSVARRWTDTVRIRRG